MKTTGLLLAFLISSHLFAQTSSSPVHGTVYGTKPTPKETVNADKIEAVMGNKVRIIADIRGKVLKVTKQKGGWFDLEAGNGKVISAHFKNIGVDLPAGLKGKTVIVEGVAQKQFIADDQQHFAGDTVGSKKQSQVKTNPKHRLTFEVTGLMVE